jgi:hypothetical protein
MLEARLALPQKGNRGSHKKFINKNLIEEAWFKAKIHLLLADTYNQVNPDQNGHGVVWVIFKRRLMSMWADETQIRRETTRKNVQSAESAYNAWIARERNLNGRQPGPARVGHLLKRKLADAKKAAATEQYRKYQELSTKEFYRKYKVPQGVQWIEKLSVTPSWEQPDTKQGHAHEAAAVLEEATRYYEWLFKEKQCHNEARAPRHTKKGNAK